MKLSRDRILERFLFPFAAAVLALGVGAARADFDDGFKAYLSGDYAVSLVEWLPLASEGHRDAQFGLGLLYDEGRGLPPDPFEAARWYLMAAEQGHALAQAALAAMYDRGRGVVQSLTESVEWYRRAAISGNAQAQYNMGLAYEEGLGVPLDLGQAAGWYALAVEQGYSRAIIKLSGLTERGITIMLPAMSDEAAEATETATDLFPSN